MQRVPAVILGSGLWLIASVACAQNDWQSPDPYFGAFQHRQAGTPQAERTYRAEIAPQEPRRLHEHHQDQPGSSARRTRAHRHRPRSKAVRSLPIPMAQP